LNVIAAPGQLNRSVADYPMTSDTSANLQNMTHADFADGMRHGALTCWVAEPYQLQGGLRKLLFNLFTLLYIAGPLIVIPIWSYHAGNWFFLIGIVFSYVASQSAAQADLIVSIFACYWIGFLVHSGFNFYHYTTFYFFCASYGYLTWQLADTVRMSCARRSLVDNEAIYDNALIDDRLRIIRLDSSGNELLNDDDFAAFAGGLSPLKPFPMLLVFSNIVIEFFTYLLGFFTGLIGNAIAHANGIDTLAPERADSIMRRLKRGTVGLLALGLGWASAYKYVGFVFGLLWIAMTIVTLLRERQSPS